MKKIVIFLVVILLCGLIIFGSFPVSVPFQSSDNDSSSILSEESSAIIMDSTEPGGDNAQAAKTDIAVDLYHLPSEVMLLVEPYADSWNAFCQVLQEETTTFTFVSSEEKGVLLEAAASLPHASLFSISGEGLDITIQYRSSYAEDCALLHDVAESILHENVYADANALETAVILYTYLVSNTTGNEVYDSVFNVFNSYEGNAAAVSGAFCFLLAQFDIPCAVVRGESETFVAAQINGQCLYFAPTEEMKNEHVRGLNFFGLTEPKAQAAFGSFVSPSFAQDSVPTDLTDVFNSCTDWRLDVTGHYLYLAYDGSSDFTAAIATSEMMAAHG